MTRDEAQELIELAAWCLRGRQHVPAGFRYSDVSPLYSPAQIQEFIFTANQVQDRGPVWMLRMAREYRLAGRFWLRGGTQYSMRRNVRAYYFVASVLRACAAECT